MDCPCMFSLRLGRQDMAREVAIKAAAKVNLHLEILGRREDGYHEIRSLFQAVSLCDEIVLRPAGAPDSLSIWGEFGFPREGNSIARAVGLFREKTGIRDGIDVEIHKKIPMAGGMGGGSSDAAAVLRGLMELLHAPLSGAELLALGGALGSDVPFFLSSAAALVEGRGEKVSPIAGRTDFALVAVTPQGGVSTQDAYRWADEEGASAAQMPRGTAAAQMLRSTAAARARMTTQEIAETYRKPIEDWSFFNDFDPIIAERLPEIRRLVDRMAGAGAVRPGLTGSGSTVIGVFPDQKAAGSCARALSDLSASVLLPLATIPSLG